MECLLDSSSQQELTSPISIVPTWMHNGGQTIKEDDIQWNKYDQKPLIDLLDGGKEVSKSE